MGAPGPIAGAGLPILLVAGGYFLVRRYRNKSKVE
jgi:LPXTG-motif cell wall-anchored protein